LVESLKSWFRRIGRTLFNFSKSSVGMLIFLELDNYFIENCTPISHGYIAIEGFLMSNLKINRLLIINALHISEPHKFIT